jgi:hypothetical protein
LSCWAQGKKDFSFYFKHYNLTIHAVKFFETFCTCFPSSLGQDLTVKSAIFIKIFPFGLLELEMADLRCFLRKKDLHSLGAKETKPTFCIFGQATMNAINF